MHNTSALSASPANLALTDWAPRDESPIPPPSTWALLLGTVTNKIADNTENLVVPLILLDLLPLSTTILLMVLLFFLQSIGSPQGRRLCRLYSPRWLLTLLTLARTILSLLLAAALVVDIRRLQVDDDDAFVSTPPSTPSTDATTIPTSVVGAVLVIAAIEWFVRGMTSAVRSMIPLCYTPEAREQMDRISIRNFEVFELGSLVGPLVLGVLLALGQPASTTLWITSVALLITDIANYFIPPLAPLVPPKLSEQPQWSRGTQALLWALFFVIMFVSSVQVYRHRKALRHADIFAQEHWAVWALLPFFGLLCSWLISITHSNRVRARQRRVEETKDAAKKENEVGTGLLVVLEGLDGAGKSTQVTRLKSWLQGEGHVIAATGWSNPCHHEVLTKILKRQDNLRSLMLTLVQAMDFVEMVNQDILEPLQEGKAVIVDR